LTQCLALEFRALNISVNALSPGKYSILTDPVKSDHLRANPERVFMKPEMMVPPALFLARQDGRGVTGQHVEALEWLSRNGHGGEERWRVRVQD
ncbi:MAG: hypothetical protein ACREQV_00375, partial [Candidatus Binatia bacterium]